jgi:flagellar hook protein FlgE
MGTDTARIPARGDITGMNAGRTVGNLSGVSIQKDGKIVATYDNGDQRVIAQIAVANFTNLSGLEKAGDNLFSATLNSGEFDGIGDDITADGGYFTTGVVEMSNVDLAAEFTEMITTQRGYQANSRIITVSDTMLEELINLKR